ncbi:DnaJ subfamily A member 2 [Aphelenchoides bicaudatus]|nr:DnaJ subfamily A member 2 [Aphelenchoides bicaudatus]
MNGEFSGDDVFSFLSGHGGASSGGGLFNLFGGGGRAQRRRKGEDTVQPLAVNLEDLYKGKTTKLKLTKKVICVDCSGRGGKEGAVQTCTRCRGSGRVMLTRQVGPGMIQQMQTQCETCSGQGQVIDEKNKCQKCNGRRTVQEQKILEVVIAPGMRENQKIVFNAEGDQEVGLEAGDVILVVKTRPHDVFQRKGDDLVIKQKITLNEAICGFSTPITHLDGRTIMIKSTPGKVIEPGSLFQVAGEGMPIKGSMERGKLYVVFDVVFPEPHFLTEDGLRFQLEKLLERRPTETLPTTGEKIEEVSLVDFDHRRHEQSRNSRREAYHDDSDDEEMGGQGGPQHVQCASH